MIYWDGKGKGTPLSLSHLSINSVHPSNFTSTLLNCFVLKSLCYKTKKLRSALEDTSTEQILKGLRLKFKVLEFGSHNQIQITCWTTPCYGQAHYWMEISININILCFVRWIWIFQIETLCSSRAHNFPSGIHKV